MPDSNATSPPPPPPSSTQVPRAVGLLGGGVIGGGWAARFLLNGIDVALFDPDPRAGDKVRQILDLAREAMDSLVLAPLPTEGRLSLVDCPQAAARDVDLVQESAPERLDLKQQLLRAADAVAGPDTVIASSTSGLLPTRLAEDLRRPERLCVAHPFNPVYLLPLVELVGGHRTAAETLDRAAGFYRSVGMHPLPLRREIDGFVADRLLEALWREALWLVADDVATVSEIDDAIRYGAGLRWASMGTFLTYRIAGGEAGMRHFMAQFGPALQWPWSRLTDVPELTGALLDRLTEQSDAQAAGAGARELEHTRDQLLVSVLQGLRVHGYGAGATVAEHELRLLERAHGTEPPTEPGADAGPGVPSPITVHRTRIPAAWIDYNGHLNESRYLQVFGDATDALLHRLGVDRAYLAAGHSFYTVETKLRFLRALRAGDIVEVRIQVLGADPRRIHAWLELLHAGEICATAEHLYLHVDTATQRAVPALPEVAARVADLARAHAGLPVPEQVGGAVAERAPWRRSPAA